MTPHTSTVSVVLVGKFDPAAFSIDSLAKAGLIGSADAETAKYVMLIKGQAVEFTLPWGKFGAVADRMSVEVTEPPYIRAMDLAARSARELGGDCLVRQFGINVKSEFAFINGQERDAVGVRLMPPANWGAFGRAVADSMKFDPSDLRHGGLMAATMRMGLQDDRPAGYTDLKVQPKKIGDSFGVAVSVNDHFESSPEAPEAREPHGERVTTAMLLELLERTFDLSVVRSTGFIKTVMLGD